MLLQFDLKHILKVNFYPSDNNFTQALLVLLVTNMISAPVPLVNEYVTILYCNILEWLFYRRHVNSLLSM